MALRLVHLDRGVVISLGCAQLDSNRCAAAKWLLSRMQTAYGSTTCWFEPVYMSIDLRLHNISHPFHREAGTVFVEHCTLVHVMGHVTIPHTTRQ